MVNVVLMAGHGKRFSDAGYAQSKPLIPVSGRPMIVRAAASMPPADRWVFVVREEHAENGELIESLKSIARDVSIIVDHDPIGQLNSCLVARNHYDREEGLFIGACDFGMEYDGLAYKELIQGKGGEIPDMVVWSFTAQPNLTRNPRAWGWLIQDSHGKITGVSVKVPISDDPYHDYAITGSFTFKSGKDFIVIAEELMRRGTRVKNEFYIDSMIGVAISLGRAVYSFPVNKYIGWGTPADYEEYCRWEEIFRKSGGEECQSEPEYQFWKEYFRMKG
ncbi:MAG: hypothetical protein A2122_03125 [Candidatus Liptonbacteria bacterium GWB1_49_6]|uniref:MobA-like NTP transferase domain-containing protein n=1 Tax=Candidatus Liptonbacteria bacterium GWB1_49_6 TaxID=1798644 RepID=A0A1G2C868_9BACT|nr:MAG: hypothetical protein A2122_03125 [Candidatus Liptonbacteria bacterium GWB1_49_6]